MIPGLTALATLPISVVPDDYIPVTYTADSFQLFMDDIREERVYVVALYLYNPATALDETVYISTHAFVSDFVQPETPEPPVLDAYQISPTGGTLLWNNGMNSQERMQSVYNSGIRRNTNRY